MQTSNIQSEPSKPFRLLDLPTELWLKIGKLVVENGELAYWSRLMPHDPNTGPDRGLLPASPLIAQTCQALRFELLPHFLKTRVQIDLLHDDTERSLRRVADWLSAIESTQKPQTHGVKVKVRAGHATSRPWERLNKIWKKEYGMTFEVVKVKVLEAPVPTQLGGWMKEQDAVYEVKFS